MAKVKTKAIAKYNGHSIKTNKTVDISFKFAYEELPNYIQMVQFLNENVEITVKQNDKKAQKLGTFMVKEIKVDHDGEGIVKFTSMVDHVEANEINDLVSTEPFKIMFSADVEEVEDEEESEDDGDDE